MNTDDLILAKMDEAVEKAYIALAGYKFWMFGYHAASWVRYNQLLPRDQKQGNPFRPLVDSARFVVDATIGGDPKQATLEEPNPREGV